MDIYRYSAHSPYAYSIQTPYMYCLSLPRGAPCCNRSRWVQILLSIWSEFWTVVLWTADAASSFDRITMSTVVKINKSGWAQLKMDLFYQDYCKYLILSANPTFTVLIFRLPVPPRGGQNPTPRGVRQFPLLQAWVAPGHNFSPRAFEDAYTCRSHCTIFRGPRALHCPA